MSLQTRGLPNHRQAKSAAGEPIADEPVQAHTLLSGGQRQLTVERLGDPDVEPAGETPLDHGGNELAIFGRPHHPVGVMLDVSHSCSSCNLSMALST